MIPFVMFVEEIVEDVVDEKVGLRIRISATGSGIDAADAEACLQGESQLDEKLECFVSWDRSLLGRPKRRQAGDFSLIVHVISLLVLRLLVISLVVLHLLVLLVFVLFSMMLF